MSEQFTTMAPTPEQKLDHMANQAAEHIGDSGGFMEPGTKKRGRPKGSKDKRSGPTQDPGARTQGSSTNSAAGGPTVDHTAELIPLVRPLWLIADRTAVEYAGDERAALGADRLQVLVQTSAQCLNQYLPDVLGKHAPLCVMLVTVMQWSVIVYSVRRDNIEKIKRERVINPNTPVQ